MSVEAVQERLICDEDAAVAVKPVGTLGAVVSAIVLFTVTVTTDEVVLLPAASLAMANKT